MKRNLLLIHLESLNNIIYKMNPSFFPAIKKIENNSMSFSKYFSTATSTLMVLGDIFYGGMEQYEQCTSLDYIPVEYPYQSSLFDDLKADGYKTGLFIYPNGGDRESAEERHIAGFANEMVLKTDYNDFLQALDDLISQEPFAIAACSYISNLALNYYVDIKKRYLYSGTEKWETGYKALDKCVKDIFALLEKKNVLGNTTVILYGDHGDDYWGHGMHSGLTHAIEPYAELIHTPFMIYDKRIGNGINNELINSTDIRSICMGLLKQEQAEENYLFKRNLTFARNEYAAQPLRNESFKKAYSVTEGKWLLLVSNEGLELYDIQMDPCCKNNFLNYFVLNEGILYYNEKMKGKLKFHYNDFMNDRQKCVVRQKCYYLRNKLYSEVKRLYEVANIPEKQMIDEMKFEKIRYTQFQTVENEGV